MKTLFNIQRQNSEGHTQTFPVIVEVRPGGHTSATLAEDVHRLSLTTRYGEKELLPTATLAWHRGQSIPLTIPETAEAKIQLLQIQSGLQNALAHLQLS